MKYEYTESRLKRLDAKKLEEIERKKTVHALIAMAVIAAAIIIWSL